MERDPRAQDRRLAHQREARRLGHVGEPREAHLGSFVRTLGWWQPGSVVFWPWRLTRFIVDVSPCGPIDLEPLPCFFDILIL